MELNRKQEEGLRIAVERYKLGEPYTVIAGYAEKEKMVDKSRYFLCTIF